VNIVISGNDRSGDLVDIASGSGFVIDAEGHIVTNNHVVEDADDVRVTFSDGAVMHAEVVGKDPFSDLAVIQVSPPPGYALTVVELGDSDALQPGQTVIAIGNPFGLTGSMTVGTISAVGRTLPSGDSPDQGSFQNPLIIQTDAAINPGNSGGPLLDSAGRVIGINSAIRTETGTNSGIGFAVPVNTVKSITKQLIEKGEVRYAYLGISSQSEPTLAELSLEHSMPVLQGVLVSSVVDGGPADKAGIRGGTEETTFRGHNVVLGGDIIIAVDGKPVRDFDALIAYLMANTEVGQTIILTVIRGGQTIEVPLTLGERPGS
jgi:2-alkenal reductase